MEIKVSRNPDERTLKSMGVRSWPVWEKEESEFPWYYDEKETFYVLEGDVTVTPEDGEAVRFGSGDLVVCPKGMSCTWTIHSAVKKHYSFG